MKINILRSIKTNKLTTNVAQPPKKYVKYFILSRKVFGQALSFSIICGTLLSMTMVAEAAVVKSKLPSKGIPATDGAQFSLPPLPYAKTSDVGVNKIIPRVVIGRDDRTFTPWAYPYSTVGQTDTGCTATMVGRMVAVTAAHCVRYSTGTITFGRGFNGSHTGESLSTIGWHWFAWGQSSFNNQNSTNDWAILIMDRSPNLGWMGVKWVPLPTSKSSASAYPWLSGWSTGYGTSGGITDNLNRFKRGSVSQTGGNRYPNWIATYDIEPGDSGSSFVQDSDGRVISIQSAQVGSNGCNYDNTNCVNLVSPSAAWWNSYIAALNANP